MNLAPLFIITGFLIFLAISVIMLVLLYQKRQLRLLKENEQLKASFEKELLESRLEIQEQTLKKISLEIHDNIGQVLSLVRLTLNTINGAQPVFLEQKLQNCQNLLGKAIQDLRDLSKTLHSDFVTDMGLIKAIQYEFELIKKAGNWETFLYEEGEPCKLSHQNELILFRIFQEVVNNMLKHSGGSAITVQSTNNIENYSITISDNGKGFEMKNFSEEKTAGFGLKSIKNRSTVIGAECNIRSEVGNGTSVTIVLPHNQLPA